MYDWSKVAEHNRQAESSAIEDTRDFVMTASSAGDGEFAVSGGSYNLVGFFSFVSASDCADRINALRNEKAKERQARTGQ